MAGRADFGPAVAEDSRPVCARTKLFAPGPRSESREVDKSGTGLMTVTGEMQTDGTYESDHAKQVKAALASLCDLSRRVCLSIIVDRTLVDSHDAEDILHEAYLKILDMIEDGHTKGIPLPPSEFFSYFNRVAYTTAVDNFRRKKSEKEKTANKLAELRDTDRHQLDIEKSAWRTRLRSCLDALTTEITRETSRPENERQRSRFCALFLTTASKLRREKWTETMWRGWLQRN